MELGIIRANKNPMASGLTTINTCSDLPLFFHIHPSFLLVTSFNSNTKSLSLSLSLQISIDQNQLTRKTERSQEQS